MTLELQKKGLFLTEAQLKDEVSRCEYCELKPCRDKCPVGCSPADFIRAIAEGSPSDYRRAAAIIFKNNPIGGICGLICPEKHCMSGCSRKDFDRPINIPAIQATIVQRAKELEVLPEFKLAPKNGKTVAIVGTGPAGISAAVYLYQKGYTISLFDSESENGGACRIIPEHRLDKAVIDSDIEFWRRLDGFSIEYNAKIKDPLRFLNNYNAVIIAEGLWKPFKPGISGEELALTANRYLAEKPALPGKVAIYGGGGIAVDCAVTAKTNGAALVELFFMESLPEMPLTARERADLLRFDISITERVKIKEVLQENGQFKGLKTVKVRLQEGTRFAIANIEELPGTEQLRKDFDHFILAIGNKSELGRLTKDGIFYAGDCLTGAATAVEAAASGKNTAIAVDAFLHKELLPKVDNPLRCDREVFGFIKTPISLKTDFFGREIISPFILSAAPPTDGLEQMKKAYKAGWAGGIMKTSFVKGPIHIPGRYMHQFDKLTYGNCDNVSGHLLDRVEKEIRQLVQLYPDRLTMASTGGPVTGNDATDREGWQGNTKRLEAAGAMGIEYSLSCPQGGDGTEGDIVSQNAALTKKIIGWVLAAGDPNIPKFFKLTGAVTSIAAIVKAVKEVFAEYPLKKAGITLANTFPTMDFRLGPKKDWEEGILFGMSGRGVLPISYLMLANVCHLGVTVSGNGGAMDYKSAAHFLALGARTVQFCTIAMKYGVGIIDDLHNGLSYLMKERQIFSVEDLIGLAARNLPITPFMELTPVKMISAINADLCEHCGNCSRCPYLAIELNSDKVPVTEASKCIGCSLCVQKCFSSALYMRERTPEETGLLREN